MEISISETKNNLVLHRQELVGMMTFTGSTPSYAVIGDALAVKLGKSKDVIAIQHVHTKFGQQAARLEIHVYDTKEHLVAIEPKVKEKKAAVAAKA